MIKKSYGARSDFWGGCVTRPRQVSRGLPSWESAIRLSIESGAGRQNAFSHTRSNGAGRAWPSGTNGEISNDLQIGSGFCGGCLVIRREMVEG